MEKPVPLPDELPVPSALIGLSSRYADATGLRALVQAIPTVGGPLDTLLSGAGSRWQYERIVSFVDTLSDRLRCVEQWRSLPAVEPSEPLFDFTQNVFEHVARTRSASKRDRFANLVANQIVEPHDWDEAEAANRLLADLTETHLSILQAAINAPVCSSPFAGLRVISLDSRERKRKTAEDVLPMDMRVQWPAMQEAALRMYCSELVGRGLLVDEGVGRMETSAMTYFVATDLAEWFLRWIAAPNQGATAQAKEGAV